MADNTNDPNPAILNLSADEKRAFGFLFSQADSDQLGVVTGERAVSFFERTHVGPNVLGEIWQIADTENRGLLTRPGFCIVLRLIGHYQAGKEPSTELAFKQGPIPKFDGLVIPGLSGGSGTAPQSPSGSGAFPPNALQPQNSGQGPIRVPPLDAQKVQQYTGLFERSGAQNGLLDGATAKAIFEKAGLPNEVLGKIWMLSDRDQRGALDQTEFIVAMHLLTSMKTRAMPALPNTLPPGFYEAASRRGAPPPPSSRQIGSAAAIPRQFTGGSASGPARAQSPLARPPTYGTSQPQVGQTTGQGPHWLITPQEKAKYDQFYNTVDTSNRGSVTGEQAVRFFSDSGLPEDTLASIWDLADINSEGQLNKDEFAVAMYLIRQQRAPNSPPLPAFLPPALVPPSMRKQNLQQQTQQTTAPAFDNANNTSSLPKSAAEDLFGLDEPSPPQQQQPVLQPQLTGASASARDPFNGSVPASPSSPSRFPPQPQQSGSMFKPFLPTSAFGASLASQNTGGSATSSQGATRRFASPGPPPQAAQPQPPQQSNAMDDLLGDNETHAAESSKLTSDTTELANMSNQIGNLRGQMEQTQQHKSTTQAELNASSAQKKALETRLLQFRAQYEQEVRTVKELSAQLATSQAETKKLGQDLALLEGGYQDLQTQHQTIGQALQADQAENGNLKQRISQINAEVARLKPEIEKMKLDARQQKGMVSINKKQLATNESSLASLNNEKSDLEREAIEAREAAEHAARSPPPEPTPVAREAMASPAGSTLSSTNPFFRKASAEPTTERSMSPATAMSGAPTPSAFDQLFGPSFAQHAGSRSATPPATSFIGRPTPAVPVARDAVDSGNLAGSVGTLSSDGRPTPSATPPLSERAKESPIGPTQEQTQGAAPIPNPEAIPPPPPAERQFTANQLPVGGLRPSAESEASSTRVLPPASRAGGTDTPRDFDLGGATPGIQGPPGAFGGVSDGLPGAFPETPGVEKDLAPGAFADESERPTIQSKAAESPDEDIKMQPIVLSNANDDFDSAFAGFGAGESSKAATGSGFGDDDDDPFAPRGVQPAAESSSQSHARGFSTEFPPIRNLEHEDESDSDDDSEPEIVQAPAAQQSTQTEHVTVPAAPSLATVASGDDLANARPNFTSKESTASTLPGVEAQQSPPDYEQSTSPVHGGTQERSSSNQFPPEFSGLLPARDDPTSPSASVATDATPTASAAPVFSPALSSPPPFAESNTQQKVQEIMAPEESGRSVQTPQTSLFPGNVNPSSPFGTGSTLGTGTSETFHDAYSRPVSSFTDLGPASGSSNLQTQPAAAQKDAFDDFDDFEDLAEAKEADKGADDFDFGFGGHTRDNSEFSTAFDSPAASMITSHTADSQATATPRQQYGGESSNGFAPNAPMFANTTSGSSSVQQTPQNAQHDWDAIFSGLDNSANGNIDTSLGGDGNTQSATSADPWAPAPSSPNGPAAPRSSSTPQFQPPPGPPPSKAMPMTGRAVTPGTEHDDPILKRLTGMGYPRGEALNALEQFDYDINKAVDHLTK